MRKCLSGFIPLMLLASTVSAADSQSADDGAIAKGNALRHPAGAKAKNGVTLEEPAGFAGTITDAGVIKNLTYQEKPIANDVFVLAGDGGISGGADKRLAFNQNTAAKGRAKVTKNADGSVSSVVDFPVKGASGTEYFTAHVVTTLAKDRVSIEGKVVKSRDFSFDGQLYYLEGTFPLDLFRGALMGFTTWDNQTTIVPFTENEPKKNTRAGFVSFVANGKLGNFAIQGAGGYFYNLFDRRQWGGNDFCLKMCNQNSVLWGGSKPMPQEGTFSLVWTAAGKIDEAAAEKAKQEAEAEAAKAAEEAAATRRPLSDTFPTRAEMWDLADAGHEKTVSRERYALNGLWAFKVDNSPGSATKAPPTDAMRHFFKVPGLWPKAGDKLNGMAVFNEKGADVFGTEIKRIDCAWYARKVEVPADWADRRVVLGFAWVPTAVLVYVDGAKAGEVYFPGGEVDLTGKLTPGGHEIALFTSVKLPEKMVQVFDAPDQVRSVSKHGINCPGLNGDVWIAAEPKGVRISDVQVRSHVREGTIEFKAGFEDGATAPSGAMFVADVYDGATKVKSFSGASPRFGGEWKDAKVWDVDAPGNLYTVKVRLERNGQALDELYAETFGFRDVVVKGRDVLLNGSPYHMRPEYAKYQRASTVAPEDVREAAKRTRAYGFNFLVDGGYGFDEGELAALELSIRESSKAGLPSVCGLPHPNRFDDPRNPHHWIYGPAYDRLVKHLVRRLQNVPGLFLWSSTHNATGYESDQNPEIMTGRPEDVPTGIIGWRQRFRKLALTVNEKMAAWDPGRPVYHHESGAEGGFYTLNHYANWTPIQERSDWYETWERKGVMPLLIVEYGTPHIASWSSYRGDDQGRNIWSARGAVQQCWLDEYNAAFLGERAFTSSPTKRRNLEIAELRTKGDKPVYFGAWNGVQHQDEDMNEVLTLFAKRNYRDIRARGVTMLLPWDIQSTLFVADPANPKERKIRPDLLRGIKDFGVVKSDYQGPVLQVGGQLPRKGVGETLVAAYADQLGWIAGPKGTEFTCVNDTFRSGEKVGKSLVILNDTRHDQAVDWVWKAGPARDKGSVNVPAGGRADVSVVFTAAADTTKIEAEFRCVATDWRHRDSFPLNVRSAAPEAKLASKVALVDPEGTAKPILKALGVVFAETSEAPKEGLLVIGRNAYAKLPFDLKPVFAAGVKIVVLEQDAATLKTMGFRIQEHGLRNLFALDAAFDALDLTDWRGNSTMIPETVGVDRMSGDFPRWKWEGFENTRAWRAGNRGIVAAALPEKPTRGDFRPILEGGFGLQYAPVMEYAEPGRRIVLSQLDVCGRTVASPEAEEALAAILAYADRPLETERSRVLVLEGGDAKVAKTFAELGIAFTKVAAAADAMAGDVLVIGPDAACGSVKDAAGKGVKILALGLAGEAANALLPGCEARSATGEACPDFNAALATEPLFRGVSNADIQWTYPSCMAGLARFGNEVLVAKKVGDGVVVFSSIAPWIFDETQLVLRVNRRRAQGLVTRLVCNLGGTADARFLSESATLYADSPIARDDPYRYYRW